MKLKVTAAVALFCVLGALPLSGSAQQSNESTCTTNCANVANTQMQQTTTATTQTPVDGGTMTTTTQTPSYAPSDVWNALQECIGKCLEVTKGK